MPKRTKQKQAGSPKLQLGLGKGILKHSTLLDTPKKKTPTTAKPPPTMAMDTGDHDDDDRWPELPTANSIKTKQGQVTPPSETLLVRKSKLDDDSIIVVNQETVTQFGS
jgi:hypothetical protein